MTIKARIERIEVGQVKHMSGNVNTIKQEAYRVEKECNAVFLISGNKTIKVYRVR
jgi:hypothetical protein